MSLESWFVANKRLFPWREEPTPYRVWVSEVMLQQTRAQVVIAYFERWMERFPTIQELAMADLELVIKMWEGLGYYSRARNLHAGAKMVMQEYGGRLPCTREELLKVPGLGPYTAGAILSFGFRQKAVAIDGNVARVIARYIWIDEEISRASAKQKMETFIDQFLSAAEPWVTTEALIELGATICTPVPHCEQCPIRHNCAAFMKGQPTALPIKAAGPKIEKIIRAIAIVEYRGSVLVRKNQPGQVMADLWEFPYFENMRRMSAVQETVMQWLYCERSQSLKNAKEAPCNLSQAKPAPKQLNLKSLAMQAGLKFSGCPTQADSNFVSVRSIRTAIEYVGKMNAVEHSFTRFCARLFPFHFRIQETKDVEGFTWVSIEQLLALPFSSGHRRIVQQLIS